MSGPRHPVTGLSPEHPAPAKLSLRRWYRLARYPAKLSLLARLILDQESVGADIRQRSYVFSWNVGLPFGSNGSLQLNARSEEARDAVRLNENQGTEQRPGFVTTQGWDPRSRGSLVAGRALKVAVVRVAGAGRQLVRAGRAARTERTL